MKDVEFVQRVRQHAPSSLLPVVARYGAGFADPQSYRDPRTAVYAPWVLADIARVSLTCGTEFRSKPATDSDFLSCCAAYQAQADPELGSKAPRALSHFLLRTGGQQMVFQQSYANDLSRTVALLGQTTPARAPEVATAGWPERLLGCTLQEYVGTAILLYAGALRNQGRFDPAWLAQPHFGEITREIPAGTLRRVLEQSFTADAGQIRAMQRAAGVPEGQFRRFGFNPLTAKPAVAGITDGLLVPVPACILRKASPLGIYYAGTERWGTGFSADLGYLFEAYVGRQLGLLPDAVVVPEIAYGPRKGELSVDWFVIFDDCVILVEVKSTRPAEPVRLADSGLEKALSRVLSKAVEQLNTSASMVRNRVAGFGGIPGDRPLIGLVVTMEPFHTVDAPFTRSYLPQCDIPFRVCSAYELEHLVTVADASAGSLLLSHFQDPARDGWSVESALAGHESVPNRVLVQAWETYPWKDRQPAS